MEDPRGEDYQAWTYQGIPCIKFTCKKSRIRVALANTPGPLVNCFMTLATESHSDFGEPHTLEHLVFLGSEDYPFKGVLDSAANRCLAQGTNAWTDTDETTYTVSTCGSEGMLRLLPAYLDHILYPTITDSGFLTEVHHIDAQGRDAGVVYCEMQGRENTGSSLVYDRMHHALYPNKESGYHAETGGKLKELRSITAQQIRDYHAAYYRPDNLMISITGDVTPQQVLDAISAMEMKIESKGPLPAMTRPWTSPMNIPPLLEPSSHTVLFPADESDASGGGIVRLAFRGPDWNQFEERAALSTLWDYLTKSAVSPLRRALIESPITEDGEPLCSSISCSSLDHLSTSYYVSFSDVPTAKLPLVSTVFKRVIASIVDGSDDPTNFFAFDLNRMKAVIHRQLVTHWNNLEEEPHECLPFNFIDDFLYSTRKEEAPLVMDKVSHYRMQQEYTSEQWISILKQYILSTPMVEVMGKPSVAYGQQLADEEANRIEQQKLKLVQDIGPDALNQLASALEVANEHNNREIPSHLLEAFTIPSIEKISMFPIHTLCLSPGNGSAPSSNEQMKSKLLPSSGVVDAPFFIQLSQMDNSEFVSLNVLLNTSSIPAALRPLLSLYVQCILESPVLSSSSGLVIPYEQVVKRLHEDTVECCVSLGASPSSSSALSPTSFAQFIRFQFKVEATKEKVTAAIHWIHDILYSVQFTPDRLKSAASKLANKMTSFKRDGSKMATSAVRSLLFAKDGDAGSNLAVANVFVQQPFIKQLLSSAAVAAESSLVQQMEALRSALLSNVSQNVRFYLSGDLFALIDQHELNPLTELLSAFSHGGSAVGVAASAPAALGLEIAIPYSGSLLKPNFHSAASSSASLDCILPLASTESNFLVQTAAGPSSFDDPDIAALYVAIEVIAGLEGPMWRRIRGNGLSYGYAIRMDVEQGQLGFYLIKASSPVKAFVEAAKIIREYTAGAGADGDDLLDETIVETARSGAIFEILSREQTMFTLSEQLIMNDLRRAQPDFNRNLLKQIATVSVEDVRRVLKKHLLPIFESHRVCVLVCNSKNVEANRAEFMAAVGKNMADAMPLLGVQSAEESEAEEEEEEEDGDDDA